MCGPYLSGPENGLLSFTGLLMKLPSRMKKIGLELTTTHSIWPETRGNPSKWFWMAYMLFHFQTKVGLIIISISWISHNIDKSESIRLVEAVSDRNKHIPRGHAFVLLEPLRSLDCSGICGLKTNISLYSCLEMYSWAAIEIIVPG